MAGKEFATARKILLEPLAGNSAFKDKAMEDRWKAKRKSSTEEPPVSVAGENAQEVDGQETEENWQEAEENGQA